MCVTPARHRSRTSDGISTELYFCHSARRSCACACPVGRSRVIQRKGRFPAMAAVPFDPSLDRTNCFSKTHASSDRLVGRTRGRANGGIPRRFDGSSDAASAADCAESVRMHQCESYICTARVRLCWLVRADLRPCVVHWFENEKLALPNVRMCVRSNRRRSHTLMPYAAEFVRDPVIRFF